MRKPGPGTGALIGAVVTAPLIGAFHAGWRLLGLPFVPFDTFDWVGRVLPGAVITAGIDVLVAVVRLVNLGSTSDVAKRAEQLLALILVMAAGIIGAGLLYAVWRRSAKPRVWLGPAAGGLLGLMALAISQDLGRAGRAGPVVAGIWILAVFVAWGVVLAWTYRRVSDRASGVRSPEEEANAVERVNRRRFLIRLGGASAAITVSGAVVDVLGLAREPSAASGARWSASHVLPNAGAEPAPLPGTRPELTPLDDHYRIDINTRPPVIREEEWRLRVDGLVDGPLALTLDQIRAFQPLHQFVTLSCISNPIGGDLIGTTRWSGVSLQRLLPHLGLKPDATHLRIRSADGFYETVALSTIRDDERVMLAYAWDGVPLQVQHGFPLRIYIPDRFGMKQPKWITSIEATDGWEPGYWVERSWDREARMRATAVIDTVDIEAVRRVNGRPLLPVGGIAHAGARGISTVEVRIDGGDWIRAALRPPMSDLTWVLWRAEVPFEKGEHTLTVRCTDGKGAAQIVEPSTPHPSGATGLHRVTVSG